MKIRWLHTALHNLEDEAAYIAEDDPAAARTVDCIRRAIDHLCGHPEIGRPGRVAGTRELVVPGTPYDIPYRVRGEQVGVPRVFHGTRR